MTTVSIKGFNVLVDFIFDSDCCSGFVVVDVVETCSSEACDVHKPQIPDTETFNSTAFDYFCK